MRPALILLTVVAALLVSVEGVMAQSNRASISGQVVDSGGAIVASATITLQQLSTKSERYAVTDANGFFSFKDLPRSAYRLTATSTGFSADTQELALSSNEKRDIKLTLHPGQIAETVVVNAGRLTENSETLERTPGSVSIVDARTLEVSRAFTSTEALRKVAGVNVREEEGFGLRPNIGIRGLNPTRSSKILLLEDGIPLTYAPYGDNASYYHPPIDRFESIEVLKGSGQILYGPSTVGGVINFITPNPPIKPSGSITLIGGNRDYFNGNINYGGTWGNTGLLFNFTRKQGEGARDNLRSGLNDFYFKSVTTFGLKQALTFRANYYGEDSNVTYSGLREDEYAADPRQNPFLNDFFYGKRFGASATHAFVFNSNVILSTNVYGAFFKRHWWRQSSNSNERPNRRNTLAGGDADCRGLVDLYTTCGNQGRLREYYTIGIDPRLRVNYNFFSWRGEADLGFRAQFENQDRQQQNGDTPTARTGVIVENNERRNQAYSGFIQNRFLFGKWTLTPGLRVERVNYERTNRLANGGLGVTGRTSLTQVIPGFGVTYTPIDRFNIFAGVHRGFAPPRTEDIINNNTGGSIDLDPELSWNYELGFRSTLRPGIRAEATFFRMDYENQIVPASLAGGIGSTLTNGGETLHQGIELTGQVDTGTIFNLRSNLYFRAAYTYLPVARFTGTRFSSINIPGETPQSINGNRLPYAPEHLLNATFGYSHPLGFDAILEAVYVGQQFADDRNFVDVPLFVSNNVAVPESLRLSGQLGRIPSQTIWNATLNYNVESWRTTFFVTFKNLLDDTFIVDRARGILPSSPRLIQSGIKFRF
jgi:Fe(3+) dicitrate transport protein